MELILTRLAEQDVSKLQELNELFGHVFDDSESYHRHKPSNDYLVAFLGDRNNIVLVAESGNRVVGGLVAYTLTKFEQERKEVYLYDLAVAKEFQRQGIGKKLMSELRLTAKGIGAYVVFLQADEGDGAIDFYKSLRPSETIRARNFDFDV